MDVLINAFTGIFNIVLLIAVGVVLAKRGWFSESNTQLVVNLVTIVALPCMIIYSLVSLDSQELLSLATYGVVPFFSVTFCALVGFLCVKFIGVGSGRKSIVASAFYVSNSVFIGIPVNIALFGTDSLPYVLIYYALNTSYFWLVAATSIGAEASGGAKLKNVFSRESLRKIVSPPLIGFLAGIALAILSIKPPTAILQTMKYLGDMTTPLSMIFIGISISRAKFTFKFLDRDMLIAVLARFVLAPLSLLFVAHFIPVPNSLMMKVFFVQASMPAMAQVAIIARAYGADSEFAAMLTTVTTLLAMLMIPLYMWLFSIGLI